LRCRPDHNGHTLAEQLSYLSHSLNLSDIISSPIKIQKKPPPCIVDCGGGVSVVGLVDDPRYRGATFPLQGSIILPPSLTYLQDRA
jgi:hypothetical protein